MAFVVLSCILAPLGEDISLFPSSFPHVRAVTSCAKCTLLELTPHILGTCHVWEQELPLLVDWRIYLLVSVHCFLPQRLIISKKLTAHYFRTWKKHWNWQVWACLPHQGCLPDPQFSFTQLHKYLLIDLGSKNQAGCLREEREHRHNFCYQKSYDRGVTQPPVL